MRSRASTSTSPRGSEGIWTTRYPDSVTLAGLVPCAESGMTIVGPRLPPLGVERAHDEQARQLARRAGRRLQRGAVHAGDLAQRALQPVEELERPLHALLGLVRVQRAGTRACAATVSATFGLYFIEHDPSG